MINLIIIDEDSRINGIGTYLQEITRIFKHLNARIYRVNHSNHAKELFSAKEEEDVVTFSFSSRLCESYNQIIDKFLGLYLSDSEQNLFTLNYTPCEDLILTLKKRFPKSKITFTIHDLTWTYHFLGDTGHFKAFHPEIDSETDTEEQKYIRKRFREEQRMFGLVDKVIVLAQETMHLLEDVYQVDVDKLCFIPNGIEDFYQIVSEEEKKKIRQKKYLTAKEKILLITGRGHYIKGLYALIRCFEDILQLDPDCRLVVVGSIIDPSTTFRLAKSVASHIVFTGQLSKDELQEWYKIADVGILTSYVEQCSYTGIEMMMYGIPVLASDGFCVGDMFQDGINAKVAKIGKRENPEKVEDFDRHIVKELLLLLQSKELRDSLGNVGRRTYVSKYQSKNMRLGYVTLIKELFVDL